jgi:hypothetical protein
MIILAGTSKTEYAGTKPIDPLQRELLQGTMLVVDPVRMTTSLTEFINYPVLYANLQPRFVPYVLYTVTFLF